MAQPDFDREATKPGWIANLLEDVEEGDTVSAYADDGFRYYGSVAEVRQHGPVVLVRTTGGDPDPFTLFAVSVSESPISFAGLAREHRRVEQIRSVGVNFQ